MPTMYASQYSQHSGYPLATIKRYCKDGIIPCDKVGRKYLIDITLADKALAIRMELQKQDSAAGHKQLSSKKSAPVKFDFLSELKRLNT